MFHRHTPRGAIGLGATRADGAGAAVDEKIFKFIFAQQGGSLLQRVAFADRAEVEHHAFAGELHGGVGEVELEVLRSSASESLGDGIGSGRCASVVYKTPALHQRREGDVKSALGLLAQFHAAFEQREDFV